MLTHMCFVSVSVAVEHASYGAALTPITNPKINNKLALIIQASSIVCVISTTLGQTIRVDAQKSVDNRDRNGEAEDRSEYAPMSLIHLYRSHRSAIRRIENDSACLNPARQGFCDVPPVSFDNATIVGSRWIKVVRPYRHSQPQSQFPHSGRLGYVARGSNSICVDRRAERSVHEG